MVHRTGTVLGFYAVLAVLSLPLTWYALTHLDVNIFNQVSERVPRFKILREVSQDFGGDILVAVVAIPDENAKDPEQVKQLQTFGDLITAEMRKAGTTEEDRKSIPPNAKPEDWDGVWLRQVECKAGEGVRGALQQIAQEYPHAVLTVEDVAALEARFKPEAMEARLKQIHELLPQYDPTSIERQKMLADPLGLSDQALETLKHRLSKQGSSTTNGPGGYMLSPDQTTLLVVARPAQSASSLPFARAIMAACQRAENRAIEAFRKQFPTSPLKTALKGTVYSEYADGQTPTEIYEKKGKPARATGLSIGFTGLHAITVENELCLKWDMLINTVTSFVTVMAVFLIFFRRWRLVWDMSLVMILATLMTFALAAIIRGKLGIMGTGFTCILLGMGADYGIFIYSTYQGLRCAGMTPEQAFIETLIRRGPSIALAASTTVVAFIGIAFTHFRSLAEMGLLTGLGMLVAPILMLSFFPVLIFRGDHTAPIPLHRPFQRVLTKLGHLLSSAAGRRVCMVLSLISIAACLGLYFLGPNPGADRMLGVRFDSEFGNLRSLSIKAIPIRDRVSERFKMGFSDLRVIAEGKGANGEAEAFAAMEQAIQRMAPRVEKKELSSAGGALEYLPTPGAQLKVLEALKIFNADQKSEQFLAAARNEFGPNADKAFGTFSDGLKNIGEKVKASKPLSLSEVLNGPLAGLLSLYARIDGEGEQKRVRLVANFLPKDLSQTQEWYDSIAKDLEQDPRIRITAARMVGFELKSSLFESMGLITGMIGVFVALLIAGTFRKLLPSLLSATPVLFGALVVLVAVICAQLANWDFTLNYVNLMIFPVLMGSGIDYGIYVVMELWSSRKPSLREMIEETGRSEMLCYCTTMAGWGTMITGGYTGLISFGWTAIFGYTATVIASLVFLPALCGMLGYGTGRDSNTIIIRDE